jgi:transcription-repair coupling factor (superfamily II helicase)
MSRSRGGNRRVASLVHALAPHLPQPGVLHVPAAARAAHVAVRRRALPAERPLVVVTRTDEVAHQLADDLGAWLAGGRIRILPERAALPLERALPEHEESAERLSVLAALADRHRELVVVAPLLALVQRTLSPEQLAEGRLSLAVGDRIGQRALLGRLVQGGYEPVVEVTGIGEFAHRGGIVDLWPPGGDAPVRIELFGDVVESIRTFDAMTQGSRRRLTELSVLPGSEFRPPDGWESLGDRLPADVPDALREDAARLATGDLGEAAETWAAWLAAGPASDHLPDDTHLVLADLDELRALAADLDRQAEERRSGLVEGGELPEHWPLPYAALETLDRLGTMAAERIEEQ